MTRTQRPLPSRPPETQHKGNPSAGPVQVGAAERVEAPGSLGGLARVHDQHSVFVVADPGVHAGAALSQSLWIDSRVLKSLPARLQHHALLRIQQFRLHRRNPEEGVVELVNVVDEGTVTATFALHCVVGEELAPAPYSGTWDSFADGVLTGFEQTPEGRDVRRAREPARHPHDRYRLCGR